MLKFPQCRLNDSVCKVALLLLLHKQIASAKVGTFFDTAKFFGNYFPLNNVKPRRWRTFGNIRRWFCRNLGLIVSVVGYSRACDIFAL